MTRAFKIAAVTALLLAGCGGGGQDPVETPEQAQQREDRAASASVAGLMDFVRSMAAGLLDDREPRPVTGIVPPASETAEPQPL